jgi:hypothetical protein
MPSVKESKIEEYLVKEMKNAFPTAEVFKFELVRRGEADRLFLIPSDHAVFVEVKRPGKGLRDEQERARQRKLSNGFLAYTVNTKQLVDNLVAELFTRFPPIRLIPLKD